MTAAIHYSLMTTP